MKLNLALYAMLPLILLGCGGSGSGSNETTESGTTATGTNPIGVQPTAGRKGESLLAINLTDEPLDFNVKWTKDGVETTTPIETNVVPQETLGSPVNSHRTVFLEWNKSASATKYFSVKDSNTGTEYPWLASMKFSSDPDYKTRTSALIVAYRDKTRTGKIGLARIKAPVTGSLNSNETTAYFYNTIKNRKFSVNASCGDGADLLLTAEDFATHDMTTPVLICRNGFYSMQLKDENGALERNFGSVNTQLGGGNYGRHTVVIYEKRDESISAMFVPNSI